MLYLGDFSPIFRGILHRVMQEMYLLTSWSDQAEYEYSYFYDTIVKDDLSERQEMLCDSVKWSVGWNRDKNYFEYVSDDGKVGFDIDTQPPTIKELDDMVVCAQVFTRMSEDDPLWVVPGPPLVTEDTTPPPKDITAEEFQKARANLNTLLHKD